MIMKNKRKELIMKGIICALIDIKHLILAALVPSPVQCDTQRLKHQTSLVLVTY